MLYVWNVRESQGTNEEIELVVIRGQPIVEAAYTEVDLKPGTGRLLTCDSQHLGRRVHCGHGHTSARQNNRVAACSGAYVYCCTHRNLIEDGLRPRTFCGDQRIQNQIVGLGPPCIPLHRIDVVSDLFR